MLLSEQIKRLDTRLDKSDDKLHNMSQDIAVGKWMLAIIIVTVVVPTLRDWLTL